ncbi:MAG: hypothetical protein ACP5CD_02440 [Thermovirgaceae bacterium]
MLGRWLPWRFFVKRTARAHGIIDPLALLARLRRFTQPSEVQEPIELLRAGIVFHARGLINAKAIQHNLDWVWPYWVERQFNPDDPSFIPRAFSFSHVNLTHRNWTAVGHPDLPIYPLVDPRGLVTPLYDGWSIDLWLLSGNDEILLPSKLDEVLQELDFTPYLSVLTKTSDKRMKIVSRAALVIEEDSPFLRIDATGSCPEGGWLIIALRPYNPEGIQFIEKIRYENDPPSLIVNGKTPVLFDRAPEKTVFSDYHSGDMLNQLGQAHERKVSCRVGMATAAVFFPLSRGGKTAVALRIPLDSDLPKKGLSRIAKSPLPAKESWQKALSQRPSLDVPDGKIRFLYDAAVRTLILLSAGDAVPGPYTYRRFWFRDACLMLNVLLALGLTDRAKRILDTFPARQKNDGYFLSQEGEWDSNGQVLWIMDRYRQVTGEMPDPKWVDAAEKAARWIVNKRIKNEAAGLHAGLFPPGFSAEHLGPNDYYYWDDFWGVAGLRSASRLLEFAGNIEQGRSFETEARNFEEALFRSIDGIPDSRSQGAIPASPYRRIDAGAVGSLVADYPLQITPPADKRIRKTAELMLQRFFRKGAFFQDIIHSGINAYLTLDIAETLLRGEDLRYRDLFRNVADLASPTGQWPEAIHPITFGGCMGDGQHGWAAAEWAMLIRNLFVREEGMTLVLGSGILPEWIESGRPLSFGPTKTPFGPVSIKFFPKNGKSMFEIDADFSRSLKLPESIIIAVPGYRKTHIEYTDQGPLVLEEEKP